MTAIGWCCAQSLCRLGMFIRLMLLLLLLNPMDIFFKRWRQIITCQAVLVCLRPYGEIRQEFRNVSEGLVQHEVLSAVVIVVSSVWFRSMMVVIHSSVWFVANMRVSLW